MKNKIILIIMMLIIGLGLSCEKSDDLVNAKDEYYLPVIKPENFVDSITNLYFPIKPGMKFKYQVQTDEENQTVEINYSNETKTILGVKCIVVDILKNSKGEIIENTLDWFAEDLDRNVWYFGENTAELENGVIINTKGSWEGGLDGAQPGIIMPGKPIIGIPYRQEYFFNEAEDMGKVINIGETVTTPSGTYNNCLVTEEWSPLEPGVVENKYYAPGVGNVKTIMVKGGIEITELTKLTN